MIVEVKNLIKRYKDVLVIDHLQLSIQEGSILGLLGPNGAGKTTTIRVLTGLTGYEAGDIQMFGMPFTSHEMEIKRQIGIVPQEIAIFEDMPAYDNVQYFARLYGLRGSLLKERVEEALEFTGLLDKAKSLPKHFSGGMKRRLNIACAIAHHPKLIIMDEPTVGIDPHSRNHIMESIRELNRRGSTIIYTSHYMEEIEELCSSIVIIDHGRVIAQGTKEELKALVATEEKISIECSNRHYTLVDNIRQIPGVRQCELNGGKLTVTSQKEYKNVSKIIDCMSRLETEIGSLYVEKSTLEDVFLTLTGRRLRD